MTGDRVSLKTLHGLMPIDLIVRCVAGDAADPLELDASGFAGPVGLLQAVREHPDFVANALGSALAENRGLSAYLPKLAKTILGEDLLIPDGPRWWLGDPAIRAACAGQHRAGRHPPGARGHGAAGPRHPRHRSGASGTRRARHPAARDRDPRRGAGGGGKGRLRHHAVADAGGPGAQALCAAPVRGRDQHRLRGHAGRPGHDGRPRRHGGAQRARRGIARRVDCQRRARRRRISACGGRPSRRRTSGARPRTCRAAPPTTCSGSAAIPSAPTGPCACCASP